MTVLNRSFGLDAFGRCSPGGDPQEPKGPDTPCKYGPLCPGSRSPSLAIAIGYQRDHGHRRGWQVFIASTNGSISFGPTST